jgi:hypothetical protein
MSREEIKIEGDIIDGVKAYLNEKSGTVLDIEMMEDGDISLFAAAVETYENGRTSVEGEIVVVVPNLELGENQYKIRAIHEDEGPQYFFSAPRIIDQLTDTNNPDALGWRSYMASPPSPAPR